MSFATIYWIDVFVREPYFQVMAESLEFCRKHKGMELFAYCILPSHVHLIYRDKENDPGKLLKELKTFTSKKNSTINFRKPAGEQEGMAVMDDGTCR